MWIVNNRKIFYSISIALVALSLAAIAVWGLRPGLDFTGGTLIEVEYTENVPGQEEVAGVLRGMDPEVSVRPSRNEGREGFIIRMKVLDAEGRNEVLDALSFDGTRKVEEKTFASIGPVLGAEAIKKSFTSIVLVILGIVLYITFAFRKVSEPVSSWKYGLVAIAALVHDVLIPAGVFAVLGKFAGYEVDTLFVTALLVILGFSVHDTIVVFDRVRENLKNRPAKKPFSEIVGESVSQTFTRSINTSLTTLIALVVLYFVGGEVTEHFSLALIIGIAAGTYSSIFIGSPLLVTIEKLQSKNAK